MQRAFVEKGAVQCGFCTPCMIMTAKGLLDPNPSPTEADVKRAISGNVCRCTGYTKIIDAIMVAADEMTIPLGRPNSACRGEKRG